MAQIRDDFWIDSKIMGKVPFSDLLEKKRRFPLLIAYKVGTKIEKILNKDKIINRDILTIMEMITSPKAKSKTYEIIKEISNKAKRNLILLPDVEPAKSILLDLINLFSELKKKV